MAKMIADIRSYQDANAFLGASFSRKLGHNTWVEKSELLPAGTVDSVVIRYHSTDIVTYWSDGKIKLDSGGWATATTKQRLNACSPFAVHQHDFGWWVRVDPTDFDAPALPFFDGMTLEVDS